MLSTPSLVTYQKVLWLDVPVNHAIAVNESQSTGRLTCKRLYVCLRSARIILVCDDVIQALRIPFSQYIQFVISVYGTVCRPSVFNEVLEIFMGVVF